MAGRPFAPANAQFILLCLSCLHGPGGANYDRRSVQPRPGHDPRNFCGCISLAVEHSSTERRPHQFHVRPHSVDRHCGEYLHHSHPWRCALSGLDGLHCRQVFVAGCLRLPGDCNDGLFSHSLLRDALRACAPVAKLRSRSGISVSYFHWVAASTLALIWLWRLADAGLGMPKVSDISRAQWDQQPQGSPLVSIVVPARNEEAEIENTLTRLLSLDYRNFEVIAVNDRSTDRTGAIMDRIAASEGARGKLRAICIDRLPSGWLGKAHAMWMAASQARGTWLLFTDADVSFKPDALRRALAYAESEAADHVVLFPRMIMKNRGERMMIAF